jgi:serine/threonine protein kinase
MNWIQRQFYAFYEEDLPAEVTLNGFKYRLANTFKYDFFAGTGLYELDEKHQPDPQKCPLRIVTKIYRFRRFFGLPMFWIGMLSVRHESRLYLMLHDIPGIPRFLGFYGKTGFFHEFIPGRPLKRNDTVNDGFFDKLTRLIQAIHDREVSYVDLNKPSNILCSEGGDPYLIDFQISYAPRLQWPIIRRITHLVLKHFQHEDRYHLAKHKRRLRPDLLTAQDLLTSYYPSLPNRLHRSLSKPYFWLRHKVMSFLKLESVE